jgi:SAM-dependent methyltransferase
MTILSDTRNTPEAWDERAGLPEPWTAAGWTWDGMTERHDELVDALKPQPGEKLLDWGCGPGELVLALPEGVKYVGYDWSRRMVDRARQAFPKRQFQTWEPLENPDVTVCCGPFNLADGWSKEMTWYMLRRLFAKTNRALAASLYAGDDPNCLSYSLGECERFAKAETFYGSARQWRHNDILILLERHHP